MAGDLAQLKPADRSFDYVICHGVYSWVPPDVQTAIFRVAAACLAEGGIAAISYNVLPGWHLRSPIRDILIAAAGHGGTPQERVARARAALAEVGSHAGSDLYGSLLKAEASRMAKMPSSYIQGEFLSEFNLPTTYSDFTSRAAGHGLSFLCEADLDGGALALLAPEARKRIFTMQSDDPTRASQDLDFVSGRPFRRSLMVRHQATWTFPKRDAGRLSGLHIACRLTRDLGRTTEQRIAFEDRRGQLVATPDAEFGQVLARLGEAYPATLPVDELIAMTRDPGRAARGLMRLVEDGKAGLTALPVTVGRASDPMPSAWPFARQEAALGLPYVTNLHHVTVHVPKIAAAIIARLDGSQDRATLTCWLAAEIATGRVQLPDGRAVPKNASDVSVLAEQHVAETIRHLAASAVLASTG